MNIDNEILIYSQHAYLIEPKQSEKPNGPLYSYVYSNKKEPLLVQASPFNIIKELCKFFGRSYESSKQHSKRVCKREPYKLPVIVGEILEKPIIFFPLLSPHSPSNAWIAYHAVKDNLTTQNGETSIVLVNNQIVTLPVKPSTFTNQFFKAHTLYIDFIEKKSKSLAEFQATYYFSNGTPPYIPFKF